MAYLNGQEIPFGINAVITEGGTNEDAVLYTEEQTLTDEQKARARANIGVAEVDTELDAKSSNAVANSVVVKAFDKIVTFGSDEGNTTIEIVVGKNKLNLAEVETGKNFNSLGEVINGSRAITGHIPVVVGKTYAFQYLSGVGWMTRLVAYDENGKLKDYKNDEACLAEQTYTVPANVSTVRFSASETRLVAEAQPMFYELTEDTEYNNDGVPLPIDWEEYTETEVITTQKTDTILRCTVPVKNVDGLDDVVEQIAEDVVEDAVAGMEISQAKYSFRNVDAVCDHYSCGGDKIEGPPKDGTTGWYDLNYVYGKYDALAEAYHDYVTKTTLGTVVKDGVDYPIYRYDFTPKLPIGSKMERLFRALYCSGTHGGEKTPIMVGVRFFKDLCENWRNQDLLRTLRFNCHFTVIPIVNPYGYVHADDEVYGVNYKGEQQKLYSRCNENGVDLNRNFTNGWHNNNGYEYGHMNFPGTHAGSETSTQLIEGMTANETFDFVIDHHTYGTMMASGPKAGYFVASTSRTGDVPFANMLSLWCNGKVVTNNTEITDPYKSYWQTSVGAGCGGYVYGCVPNGFCFENMTRWGTDAMEAAYPSQKFNAETIGALFHSAFVSFHSY